MTCFIHSLCFSMFIHVIFPKQNTLPLLTNSIEFPLSLFYLQCLFLNLEYCIHVGPPVRLSVHFFLPSIRLFECLSCFSSPTTTKVDDIIPQFYNISFLYEIPVSSRFSLFSSIYFSCAPHFTRIMQKFVFFFLAFFLYNVKCFHLYHEYQEEEEKMQTNK